MNMEYLVSAMLVMIGVTFSTRAAPFLLLRGQKNNRRLKFVGEHFPPAAMLLLVFYCIKDSLFSPTHGGPEIISIAVVVALHQWKRIPLLSIVAGTGLYMYLVQR